MITPLLLLLLCSLLLLLGLFLLHTAWVHSKYDHLPGPPRHRFLLGHTRHLIQQFYKDSTGFSIVREYFQLYGPVFVLWFTIKPMVVITDPDSIKETIVSNIHKKLGARAEMRLWGQRFCGEQSIFVNPGDEVWARNKKAYSKWFGRCHLRHYHHIVGVVARRLTTRLAGIVERQDGRKGSSVNMNNWMNLAACDIIGLVAFQWDIDSVTREDETFAGFLELAFTGAAVANGVPFSRLLPKYSKLRGDTKQAVRELRLHCAHHIQQYKVHLAEQEDLDPDDQPEKCLLDEILDQTPDDLEFQVDEMLAFFLAGQETVAHVLTFALSHVMRDTGIRDLCEGEVAGYMAAPSYEALTRLLQLDMLMRETLRHYAPVPGLRRILARDTEIAGYLVPKGTLVVHVLNIYGHNEAVWGSDHLEFNPRRFDKSCFSISKSPSSQNVRRTSVHSEHNRHAHSFLPFGIGPRVCIGKELAKIEFKVLMAHLLEKFRFVPVPGEEVEQMRYSSVKPKSGFRCYVHFK